MLIRQPGRGVLSELSPYADPCGLTIQRKLTDESIGALFEQDTYKDGYPQMRRFRREMPEGNPARPASMFLMMACPSA
jgi:hypothetical protein